MTFEHSSQGQVKVGAIGSKSKGATVLLELYANGRGHKSLKCCIRHILIGTKAEVNCQRFELEGRAREEEDRECTLWSLIHPATHAFDA